MLPEPVKSGNSGGRLIHMEGNSHRLAQAGKEGTCGSLLPCCDISMPFHGQFQLEAGQGREPRWCMAESELVPSNGEHLANLQQALGEVQSLVITCIGRY